MKFFDYHVKGLPNGLQEEAPIHYFTMGEGRWKAADHWPPQATKVPYYFSGNHQLTTVPPTGSNGADIYQVDVTAGTGPQSRWHTLLGRPIMNPYPDRELQGQKLLLYTSPTLEYDLEVTGHPMVSLWVSSTATDGNFFLYLEDVNEAGEVSYVTEGLLRALHRHRSTDTPPYQDVVPYRSFQRKDGKPLSPGKITHLEFELLPTSYLFKKGHRIRVALAGADKDHFPLIPPSPPTLTYYRNATFPSHVILPVVNMTRVQQ